jgi:hypothetical protein
VSQSGGKGSNQNIQVVRTVLSQPGLKPGQAATILISQPSLQQAAQAGAVISSAQVLHTGAPGGVVSVSGGAGKPPGRGSPKGKSQPVYARIIQPPPGIKLTSMGQVTGAQSPNMLQTVSKLLSISASQAVPSPTGVASSTPSPAVVVAAPVAVSQAVEQSLLKSQSADSANTGADGDKQI